MLISFLIGDTCLILLPVEELLMYLNLLFLLLGHEIELLVGLLFLRSTHFFGSLGNLIHSTIRVLSHLDFLV